MSTNVQQLNENILSNRNPKRTISSKIVYVKKSNSKNKNKISNNTMRLENKAKSKIPLQTINENDKNDCNIKRKLFEKEDSNTNDNNSTPFSLDLKKEKEEKKESNLNMENLLVNISLKEKNKFTTEEYREMFSKYIRDEYSNAIINSLLIDEEINENYLANHKITERMRTRMIDWMIEVLSNYHCDESTYFESVNLMDRYFKICDIKKKILQPAELHLIGVTCMFIASKYQDIYPLRLKIMHEKIAHRKLSTDEIKRKEEEITRFLNYSIGKPTMWDFINFFIEEIFYVNCNNHHIKSSVILENYNIIDKKKNSLDKDFSDIINKLYTKNMINLLNYVCVYLAKMNCHDYNLMQKKPSLLAASTIFVAIKICEQINKEDYINNYFNNKLSEISQKSENDIIKVAQKILYNAQNFDTLFNGLENLKKVHFNAIIELKNTK